MLVPIQIKDTDKILIVAPHPDDECIGCGGVIARYSTQCDVVVLTDGSMSDARVLPNKMRAIRKAEFESEMKDAGVNSYRMLNYPDGNLMHYPDCMQEVDMSSYDLIFLPWGDDDHPDHTASFLYTKEAAKSQKVEAKVYQYEVHVPLKNPDSMIDISEVIGEKEKLIEFHKSQLNNICYDKKAVALAKYRACESSNPSGYVEAYLKTNIYIQDDEIDKLSAREKKLAKNVEFVKLLSKWVERTQDEWTVSSELLKQGYKEISIYGFSDLGRLLYLACKKYDFPVKEIFDNRILKNNCGSHKIIKPVEGYRAVDAIVVTAISDFESVSSELHQMGYSTVVSLKNIIYGRSDE